MTLGPVEARARLMAKAVIVGGCWIVTSGLTRGGYARVRCDGVELYAHRFMYEQARGPIPPGLVIDHLCRNRACVNPDHLEAVTQRTNVLRGEMADRGKRLTHCPHGHAYTPENTYVNPKGSRVCRTCTRQRHAARTQVKETA